MEREREHGDVEEAVQGDIMAQQALRTCGLYKFQHLGSLRAKPRLFQLLVDYWYPESESCQLDGMSLSIEVEDIYFIIGLPLRGEVVNFRSHGSGGKMAIDEYIVVYCLPDTEKVGSQILTNDIQNLGLKYILLELGRIAGLASLHQASRPMMFYVVECIRPMIYEWSTSLLSSMKQ